MEIRFLGLWLGTGVTDTSTLDITDRLGAGDSFAIDQDGSLSDIVALINASAIQVTASNNDTGTGLLITDPSGGTLALLLDGAAAHDLVPPSGPTVLSADTHRG